MTLSHLTSNTDHEGENFPIGSKKYLPGNLQEVELYDEVCDWIDHVLAKGDISHDFLILDEVVTQLITIFKDKEALASYYNLFVRSIIGTRSALDFLLDLLQFEPRGKWKEWFEMDWPIPPYKITLEFGDEYPRVKDPLIKWIDWNKVLDLFTLIKNERSLIAHIRMQDCSNMLLFDYASFDNELFDDLEGIVYRNVRFCFYEKHREHVDLNYFRQFNPSRTTYHSHFWEHSLTGALDSMYLDSSSWYYLFFFRSETHYYFQELQGGSQPSPSFYRWNTWKCQIVLDDFGELCDGTGTPGDMLRMDTFYLSGDESLDEVVGEWVMVGCDYEYISQKVLVPSYPQSVYWTRTRIGRGSIPINLFGSDFII